MRLSVGIGGFSLTPRERLCLLDESVDEVILFARNIREREQVKELTREIHGYNCAVSIDHEGGRVHRFPNGFEGVTHFPSLATITKGGDRVLRSSVLRMADELWALGVDVMYAPVVDLYRTYAHNVIGDRSPGFSPAACAHFTSVFLQALKDHPIQTCAKHFPGHGRLLADSHLELPTLFVDEDEWWKSDALPFRAAAEVGVDRVMFAHLRWPAQGIEHSWRSNKLIGMARSIFGSSVEFVSDDISMGAVQNVEPSASDSEVDELLGKVQAAGFDRALLCSAGSAGRRYHL